MKKSIFATALLSLALSLAHVGCGVSVEATTDETAQKDNKGVDALTSGEEKTNKDLLIAEGDKDIHNTIVVDPVEGEEFAGQWNFAPKQTVSLLNGGYQVTAIGCDSTAIELQLFWGEFNDAGEMIDGKPFSMTEKVTAEAGKKYGLLVSLGKLKGCKRVVVQATARKA